MTTEQHAIEQNQIPEPARPTHKTWRWNELKHFIGASQRVALDMAMQGEEGAYFRQIIGAYAVRVIDMPKTYEQDGVADPIAYLHYFKAGMDAYITERDTTPEQLQAFGWIDFGNGDGGELGYIDVAELNRLGVELDLHFEPQRLSQCVRR